MERRHFLTALSAAMLALASPSRTARADAGSKRRFLFVFAQGGWDPLCVFAPLFGQGNIEVDEGSAPMSVGGFALVDSAERPSVRAFFQKWGKQALLFNGVSVRSVSHDVCTQIVLTGRSSDAEADWASRLAGAQVASFALPHLSFSGPVLPGEFGAAVAQAGTAGQLAGLVDGSLFDRLDKPPWQVSRPAERALDRFHARRVTAFGEAHQGMSADEDKLLSDFAQATDRMGAVKLMREELTLNPGTDAASQLRAAVAALGQGLSRCVSIGTGASWDTHVDNHTRQSPLFEDLFRQLDTLCTTLAITPGPGGTPLSEETVVVVLSEMARTPRRNANHGRDHWPFTSALVIGPGVTGGRIIGGYDAGYLGVGVDLASGDVDAKAQPLTTANLGATLLALGGVDPATVLSTGAAVQGALT